MAIYPVTLVNPGAELANTSGWTTRSGGVIGVKSGGGHTGSYYFVATADGATAIWDQQVAIDPAYHAGIDTGGWYARGYGWQLGWSGDTDYGKFYLQAVSADGTTILATVETNYSDPAVWTKVGRAFNLPVGTRYLRIGTDNVRVTGTELSMYWDDFELSISDMPYPIEMRIIQPLAQNIFSQSVPPSVRINWLPTQNIYYQLEKPDVRINLTLFQNIYYPLVKPFLRIIQPVFQHLVRAPEEAMSNDIFPASANIAGTGVPVGRPMLRGMTYNNKARPMFSTKIAEHTSGRETATSYWENPRWEFELSFDYLPNLTDAVDTDFKTLCGFFMARRGKFDTFLFRNPDDYKVSDLLLGTGDGIRTEWELYRKMGIFNEPIGQIDIDNLDVWLDGPKDYVIAAVSPYTVTLHPGTVSVASVSIGGTILTDVSPAAPATTNEYSRSGNTLTFHSTRAGATATVDQRLLATVGTDYTVLMPRTLVFTPAPATGVDIITTFEFFFACRFVEDMQDFEQFAHRLWDLKEMTLRSIIQ